MEDLISGVAMVKRIILIILSLLCLVFLISGIWHLDHSVKYDTVSYVPNGIEVLGVSKDSYEVQDDGTVLIHCKYTLLNTGNEPQSISVGGIFLREKAVHFIKENVLFADGTYTLDPGIDTVIEVVFVGHIDTAEKIPDRLPPKPYIVVCDNMEE